MGDDTNWSVVVKDNVMVWEFSEGMELSEFRETAWEKFNELVNRDEITAMVTIVRLDDPFDSETFEVWENSAQKAADEGVERWGIVAEGIKKLSLKGKVNIPGLEVYTTEDPEEAIQWGKGK